jgi:hypothetical protein
MHSPDGVLESGLLGCLPEKKVRKPACRIGQDTFSGPLCVKDSRNYGQFERFHKNCGLFSLHVRLYGGAGSLALTFLCPNSLLTGNLTGNFENFGLQNRTSIL